MKLLALFFALNLFACCSTSKIASNESNSGITSESTEQTNDEMAEKPERDIMIKAELGEFEKSDAIDINAVRVEGNKMYLEVSYSGGCAKHLFKMIGSTAIKKSLPPIRSIQLVHKGNNDVCRSIVKKTIQVDISDLAYPGGDIILQLDGWKGNIIYKSK